MDSLLHTGGTLLTILFIAAVLYSLLSSFRKKRKKAARQKDLETKQHVQVENLHQYDVQPQKATTPIPSTPRTPFAAIPSSLRPCPWS